MKFEFKNPFLIRANYILQVHFFCIASFDNLKKKIKLNLETVNILSVVISVQTDDYIYRDTFWR